MTRDTANIAFVLGVPNKRISGVFEKAEKVKDHPFSYDSNLCEGHTMDSMRCFLDDLLSQGSTDIVVVNEDLGFNLLGQGYTLAEEFGFGDEGLPSLIIASTNHTKTIQKEVVGKRSYQWRKTLHSRNALAPTGGEEEYVKYAQVFDLDETGPMLNHADAVVHFSKNTIGDILEIARRCLQGGYLGTGAFRCTSDSNFDSKTLSAYWTDDAFLKGDKRYNALNNGHSREHRYDVAVRHFIREI